MPLHFVAIGSGEKLKEKVASIREMIFAAPRWQLPHGVDVARDCYGELFERCDEKTVGGLFPMVKLEWGCVMRLGQNSKGFFPGGYEIRLEPMSDGSWVQKNLVTGKEIPLLPPWEIKVPATSITFDDVRYGIFG
jgi:hypothetical protein